MNIRDFQMGSMLIGLEIHWIEIERLQDGAWNIRLVNDEIPQLEVIAAKLKLIGYKVNRINVQFNIAENRYNITMIVKEV